MFVIIYTGKFLVPFVCVCVCVNKIIIIINYKTYYI